jgi:predicted RNase H-like HicB family nuclease
MRRAFTAQVWKEGDVYVSQCLEIDISSYGDTEQEALDSLTEALELYLGHLYRKQKTTLHTIEVEITDAAQSATIS